MKILISCWEELSFFLVSSKLLFLLTNKQTQNKQTNKPTTTNPTHYILLVLEGKMCKFAFCRCLFVCFLKSSAQNSGKVYNNIFIKGYILIAFYSILWYCSATMYHIFIRRTLFLHLISWCPEIPFWSLKMF